MKRPLTTFSSPSRSIQPYSTPGSIWPPLTPSNTFPASTSEDNNRLAQQAIDAYKAVLEKDPKNITSVKGIGYLYLNMKKFDQAKDYYRKASELDPNDPEPHYTIGVIDWTQMYQPAHGRARQAGSQAGDESLKDKKVCAQLKQKNSALIAGRNGRAEQGAANCGPTTTTPWPT